MIIQSPESAMPEPFKTYVRQRSQSIANILDNIVDKRDVQLCPRAVTPDEVIFPDKSALIYGAVVDNTSKGFKSILYTRRLWRPI